MSNMRTIIFIDTLHYTCNWTVFRFFNINYYIIIPKHLF